MDPVTGTEKELSVSPTEEQESTSSELQDSDEGNEEYSPEELEDFKIADIATAAAAKVEKSVNKTGSDGDAAASALGESAKTFEKQELPTSPEANADITEAGKAEEKPITDSTPDPASVAQKGTPGAELTTPEAMAAQWSELRKNAEVELARHYALGEAEVEELGRNAEVTIPKLMAKVYMDVYQTLFSNVVSVLPKLVGDVTTAHRQAEANEARFFDTWKDLAAHPQGKTTTHKLAVSYRQVYPNATLDEIIRDVGAQAMVALKIPFNGLSSTIESEDLSGHLGSLPGGGSPPTKPPIKKASNYFSALAEAEEAEILE